MRDYYKKLSIITPYYKTLPYTLDLARVLEPQLNDNVEWIIIDDGCNEKELDKLKAKVIHLENPSGNASRPRNVGLDNAKGEYITFIDSDDLVSNDYVQKILEKTKENWDYCYMSWSSQRGTFIIQNQPPKWNTSVWNCVYKKELIGNVRFNESKNIAEDEEFNLKVRKGIKANITEVLYQYNWGRQDSLTTRYSKGEISNQKLKCSLLLYQKYISKIGGIETFIYNFVKLMSKDYDITLVYKEADIHQLMRYRQYVRCIKYENQFFECDKYICVSNQDNIADNVVSLSGDYYDMIHADFKAMNWKYRRHPKTTKHICVSNIAKEGIELQDDKPCVVIYNLLDLEEHKKPLMIMSAQRFSREKGKSETEYFVERLTLKNIPYVWICFTDNKKGMEKGICYVDPVLNLKDYYEGFDYFASFSSTESYGYSIVEAMSYGVPLIVRDIPVLKELGFKDGVHGYKINFDMSNVDEVIDKLWNKPKGEYKKLDNVNQWKKELGNMKKYNEYKHNNKDTCYVRAIKGFTDIEAHVSRKKDDVWEVSIERGEQLAYREVAVIID